MSTLKRTRLYNPQLNIFPTCCHHRHHTWIICLFPLFVQSLYILRSTKFVVPLILVVGLQKVDDSSQVGSLFQVSLVTDRLAGASTGEFTLWNGFTFNFETILQAHDSAVCSKLFLYSLASECLFRLER